MTLVEVVWVEGPALRWAATTSLQAALSLWADLSREGKRARVWIGAEMIRGVQ